MKRVLGLVMVFGAASFAATDVNPHSASVALANSAKKPAVSNKAKVRKISIADLAPADEYFGPLKQSVVGINNTIRDLGLRYDVNHDISAQTLASAALTERAIKDWQRKYPHDDQLPRSLYFLQRLYDKVITDAGRLKAKATAQWMFASFGSTPQARQLHKMLALEAATPVAAASAEATPPADLAGASGASAAAATAATSVPAPSSTNAGPGYVTPAPLAPAPAASAVAPAVAASAAPAAASAAPAAASAAPVSPHH